MAVSKSEPNRARLAVPPTAMRSSECSLENTWVSVVTIDGAVVAMGRTPNADAANAGYLTAESATGTSISDPALQGAWYPAPDAAGFRGFANRYKAKFGADPVRTAPEHLRVRLDLSYDGTGFAGWATQPGLRADRRLWREGALGVSTVVVLVGRVRVSMVSLRR